MAFSARYGGTECAQCTDGILKGDIVEYNFDGDLQHVYCPDDLNESTRKPLPVCPRCFLTMVKDGNGGYHCGACDD